METAPAIPSRKSLAPFLIGAFVLFVAIAFSRFGSLGADPPYWMSEAFMTDEGWWADSARGEVFFNDPYADDFGTPFLLTPAYTLALRWIYQIGGVGIIQTRSLAAISNVLTIFLITLLVWKMANARSAFATLILLGLSPFFWAHGRVGYQESFQALFITLSLVCWLLAGGYKSGALAAGLALGVSVAIKPTGVPLGILPVGLAALVAHFVEQAGPRSRLHGPPRRLTLLTATCLFAGLAIVAGVFFVTRVIPNWDTFWPTLFAQTGIQKHLSWKEVATIPGRALVSTEWVVDGFQPRLLRVAHYSPAIMIGVWLFFLSFLLEMRTGAKRLTEPMGILDLATMTWVLATWAMISSSYLHPDRRYILLLPGLGLLAGLFLSRSLSISPRTNQTTRERKSERIFPIVLWFVLLFPAMILLAPVITQKLMDGAERFSLGRFPGIGYGTATNLFLLIWFFILIVASRFSRIGEAIGLAFIGRVGTALVIACMLAEILIVGEHYRHLQHTMMNRQKELAGIVHTNEVVLGHAASSLFQPIFVRTVRRPLPDDVAARQNPDVWERLQPRYILECTRWNFRLFDPFYADLTGKGYRVINHFDVGPVRADVPRFEFDLYERPPGRVASE